MQNEQYLLLNELKQKFPNSNYIVNAEAIIQNYTDIAESSDNQNALMNNQMELQRITGNTSIRISKEEYQKGFGTLKVPKKLEQILQFQNQYGIGRLPIPN